MANVVYTTTLTKPGNEVALANALYELLVCVPLDEVLEQAVEQSGPRPSDSGRALCFRLTDKGLSLYRHGFVPPPQNFREWPKDKPEPDFSRYPIDRPNFL